MINIWKCLAEYIMTLHLSKTMFRKISPAEKKSLAITRWRSSLKVDRKETKTIIEQRWKQMNTSRNMKNTPIYKQPRNVWDDVLVSNETKRTYFNPPPPCPFQREYNGSLKNRKDGIVFFRFSRWSRIVCSFVSLCCRQFCFRGCFSPNVVNLYSGTGERGSSWETLRGALRRKLRTRCVAYRRYQTFRRLAPRDERTISCPSELLGDT